MGNVVEEKSFQFALRIVRLCSHIQQRGKEYVLSKQLLRSGTSIGANVVEAQQGQSRRDFLAKMNIALKECSETKYWIRLMSATEYINAGERDSILSDCVELEKILTAIIRTTKEKLKIENEK